MAKVSCVIAGGPCETYSADTVEELATKSGAQGFTAAVNGEPANGGDKLQEDDFVSFSEAVRSGS